MYLRPNAILSQIREAVELVKGRSKWPVKIEWALQRGGRSAHPFSWLLSSPQQPLETEDPPTVSLAPQYTSQPLCRAIEDFLQEKRPKFLCYCRLSEVPRKRSVKLLHGKACKTFSTVKILSSGLYQVTSLAPISALISAARLLAS